MFVEWLEVGWSAFDVKFDEHMGEMVLLEIYTNTDENIDGSNLGILINIWTEFDVIWKKKIKYSFVSNLMRIIKVLMKICIKMGVIVLILDKPLKKLLYSLLFQTIFISS